MGASRGRWSVERRFRFQPASVPQVVVERSNGTPNQPFEKRPQTVTRRLAVSRIDDFGEPVGVRRG
jgi:hypothetical protein